VKFQGNTKDGVGPFARRFFFFVGKGGYLRSKRLPNAFYFIAFENHFP
jgi:hypothetical protein